jgi:tetratricopeptide (TPR) repeat protein
MQGNDRLNQGPNEGRWGPFKTLHLVIISIFLWVGLAGFLAYRWLAPDGGALAPPRAPPAAVLPASAPGAEEALAAMVAQRLKELDLPQKKVVTPSDLGLETALAIKSADFVKAAQITQDVLARSQLQSWRFYPFNEFIGSVPRGDDPVLLKNLSLWIKKAPNSATAYLIRAAYYAQLGWAVRGSDIAQNVPARSMEEYESDMQRSKSDLLESIRIDPKNPWTYYELLRVAASDGNSQEAERVFQIGIAAFPAYYPLYKARLHSITPKWGGSVGAMYKFVDRYVNREPSTSPLRMLYLDLYADLLDAAAFDCRNHKGGDRQYCMKTSFDNLVEPELAENMHAALNLYKGSDPAQFGNAVWSLLAQIACDNCTGAPPSVSGAVLQAAATAMGSDTRIMDDPAHNSYVLDDITARAWAQMGNNANADRKFHEALDDVRHASFTDEAERATAAAAIFDHMAAFADDASQFVDIIVYHEAANTWAGTNHTDIPYRKCYAYYRMKHFVEAVRECTALIEANGNYMQTHYWRAKAYEGLHQWDASIADFTRVADSADNWFRVGAALDMSFEFGQKGDFAGQLASMNAHQYLFDEGMQPVHDLAVAYNNRCFANMKLGRLQEALSDCSKSLTYDRIPDAYQKQQELLKLLGSKTT